MIHPHTSLSTETILNRLLQKCYLSTRRTHRSHQTNRHLTRQCRDYASSAVAAESLPAWVYPFTPADLDLRLGSGAGREIGVIGGGITGLASAYYLSTYLPNSKITLYESGNELGGWIRTKSVEVEGGNILFEQGPRTLRPHTINGKLTLDLMARLGLQNEVILTPSTDDAAKNRFVYYPDRLVKMPGPGQGFAMFRRLFEDPAFEGLISGALGEFQRATRPADVDDESVHDFISRRLGSTKPAENLLSAVLHGIYAGDSQQLSAKSLFPRLYDNERVFGSLSAGAWAERRSPVVKSRIPTRDIQLIGRMRRAGIDTSDCGMSGVSVYSFKNGIGTLTDALVNALKAIPNVTLKLNTPILQIRPRLESKGVTISLLSEGDSQHPSGRSEVHHTDVLSTISARKLSTLTHTPLPALAEQHSVTVMVVNLYFADPNLLPVHGFGYLLPRSVPLDQNPERALGVVFDSDAVKGQDNVSVPGTKVTVMMGGHWWDDFDSYPSEDEAIQAARSILQRHLGITATPTITHTALGHECIPQYTVGHDHRMFAAHFQLQKAFNGRLQVAGNSYTGVGLNDCVRAAWDRVHTMTANPESSNDQWTGLEHFDPRGTSWRAAEDPQAGTDGKFVNWNDPRPLREYNNRDYEGWMVPKS